MTTRNQSLDLLRGIAILMVVASHCANHATSFIPGLLAFTYDYGQLGVQLFFIVSGYTMMLTYGGRTDLAAAGSFYLRRAFRIVPLFWIAIVFYLVITRGEGVKQWAPEGLGAPDVVLTALFLHLFSLTAFNSVVPGGWSIGVEMQFYLLFPLIIRLFRQPNGPVACYALIAATSVAAGALAKFYLVPHLAASLPPQQAYLAEGFYFCWLPRQVICFGLGLLFYDIVERGNRPRLGALLLAGACLTSAWGAQVALLGAMAYVLLKGSVANSVLGLLGRHSYAIYLVHFPVVPAIAAWLHVDILLLTMLVAGASLALSYFIIEPMIERRFNRLGHQLAADLGRSRGVATA
ncbi:acyltransferase [Bradyrhizobium sp. CCBAU 51753]|uniref:acyltransferase family protein n=1 Tax=Bradyrhizobium sp. CCBAU 51753 TaxID=1325100 RepID=UPI00188A30C4|nr:acyltransferase [Bradyrhizobium sp. CCBAU 51753]QOZ29029.1 acyltransferase [Bradyrhizobium sp. CCBAU 51753]